MLTPEEAGKQTSITMESKHVRIKKAGKQTVRLLATKEAARHQDENE